MMTGLVRKHEGKAFFAKIAIQRQSSIQGHLATYSSKPCLGINCLGLPDDRISQIGIGALKFIEKCSNHLPSSDDSSADDITIINLPIKDH